MPKTVKSNHSLFVFNPYIGHLSDTTTPGQSGPGINGNEGVLRILQSSSITGASPSDCLVSYPGHSWGWSYPYAEKLSVYSTASANWAKFTKFFSYKLKPLRFYGSHFLGYILIFAYTICQHLAQFSVNHLSHPVMPGLVFLLCQLAAFAYLSPHNVHLLSCISSIFALI